MWKMKMDVTRKTRDKKRTQQYPEMKVTGQSTAK
jgi:hypothetical protein